jgi:hypothetical protein
MSDTELRDEMTERVAETVRHALALVGPADSTTVEVVEAEETVG